MGFNQPLAYCPGCRGRLGHTAGHAPAADHGPGPGPAHGQPPANCPYCALPLAGGEIDELLRVDVDLAALERRRAALHERRHALLAGLRARGAGHGAQGPAAAPAGAFGPPPAHGPVPKAWGAARAETSSYTARNVLLLLGGVLLTVAALAFTLLSWGDMGVGGRAAVLGGLTLCTLAAPLPLLHRGLAATAESVAGFGLALLALDAYALHEVGFPQTDGLGWTAGSAALIAAVWAGYGLALPSPGLRLTLPSAVAVAQFALPLGALALDGPADRATYVLAVALLVTFAADVALAASRRRTGDDGDDGDSAGSGDGDGDGDGPGSRATARPVRWTAALAAVPAGALMTGMTLAQQQSGGVATALSWSALPAAAAAVLLYAGRRREALRVAGPLGVTAGLLLVAALAGTVWSVVRASGTEGGDWRVLVYLLCATGLLGALLIPHATRVLTARQSSGLAVAALAVETGALVWALVPVVEAVFGPWRYAGRIWQGPPHGPVRQAVDTHFAWTGSAATPLILVLLALSAPLLAGALGTVGALGSADSADSADSAAGGGRRSGGGSAPDREPDTRTAVPVLPALTALGAAAGATAVLVLPYGPAVAVIAVLAVALLAASVTVPDGAAGVTALVSGLVLSGTATGWALAQQGATLGVLALMGGASAASAAWSRTGGPGRRAALAASAVAYAAGLAGALAATLHLPAHQAPFAVLAVAVCTVPVAALLARGEAAAPGARKAAPPAARTAMALAVECAGYATALAAVMLCAPRPETLWLVLALCAVTAAGLALRADRRRGAGYGSAALLVLATWVRLLASGVTTPEAYTLPVSAALLLLGWLRRRRTGVGEGSGETAGPRLSSWLAYGGGLAFTFLPSLVMVASDPHWLRPLLLGAAALGTTLAGARWRAQAPLLLGGATLAAVGVHELAPYVVQVAWLLPRWLVPALAGLLLVAAGATYERRLEEARRLKRAWQRLS
ncbi:hypothetical protein H181DRAFT_01861 [Streptomyces sp. WMMB 714]|uniref:SCO7613 C-terminal domain-containing membrane protein n=1 Tax=Streptomyces sp. WMMB 714 TaxID=1286822 RepID=UPI000695D8EA|nr:hypothetical protein [Streptomyces sp. WMMB 714]SCK24528.1 hypothetical protein H181DRAFT_01861 [Streptomyces sp. WMMB 714]